MRHGSVVKDFWVNGDLCSTNFAHGFDPQEREHSEERAPPGVSERKYMRKRHEPMK